MKLPDHIKNLVDTLRRGPNHRRRLSEIDTTIAVTGTRGKSAATRWLYEILHEREHDVLGKVTGNRPVVLHDGTQHEIERSRRVTLYENEQQLRRFAPVETLVLENQGIGEYTSRVVHERFADPDVVFLTNIRRDHLDRLGRTPLDIARALARTIPADTAVVSGAQPAAIRDVLDRELTDEVDSVTHVNVPDDAVDIPGAEVVYGLDEVLDAVGESPLTSNRKAAYLEEMRVSWTQLPNGRVYNAASVNDVDSTEVVRQALVDEQTAVIQPLVYLRADRRARTVSFLEYLETLYDDGCFEIARAVGPHAGVFSRHASFPVATHDEANESASDVLDDALGLDWPVFVAGNTVAEFMRDLESEIETRRVDTPSNRIDIDGLSGAVDPLASSERRLERTDARSRQNSDRTNGEHSDTLESVIRRSDSQEKDT